MANNPIMVPMTVASDSEALAMSVGVSIGGGSAILGTKEITNNGVYNAAADGYDGYSSVDVQVAGGSATLGEKSVTANGVYNASSDSLDGYSKVTVSVPASAVDSGTKSITANGNNQDVVGYAAVDVAVPNSYSAGDEGKVVDSGALVAQTAHADVTPTTSDQTIDTTLNNSIKVIGDADLVASNIKKDVEIFGVTGSYEGGGGGSDTYADYLAGTLTVYNSKNATSIVANGIRSVSYIVGVVLPELATVASANMLFAQNSNLEYVDLGKPDQLYNQAFYNDSKLDLIILRKSTVVSCANSNIVQGTPFANGGAGGEIYVPSALINSYKAASNWSVINGYGTVTWKAIEGSYYETHYADGTPIS